MKEYECRIYHINFRTVFCIKICLENIKRKIRRDKKWIILLLDASKSQTLRAPDNEPAQTIISLGSNRTHSTDVVCPVILWKKKRFYLKILKNICIKFYEKWQKKRNK